MSARFAAPGFWHPASLIATVGGIGLSPVAPGTLGSAIALPLAWGLQLAGGPELLFGASALLFLVGWWAAQSYIDRTAAEDPPAVVVDEVVAQWLVLLLVPLNPWLYLLSFALFRLFDIVKPWPVSLADQRIKGGFGTMLDDLLAAVYAGIALAFCGYVWGRL